MPRWPAQQSRDSWGGAGWRCGEDCRVVVAEKQWHCTTSSIDARCRGLVYGPSDALGACLGLLHFTIHCSEPSMPCGVPRCGDLLGSCTAFHLTRANERDSRRAWTLGQQQRPTMQRYYRDMLRVNIGLTHAAVYPKELQYPQALHPHGSRNRVPAVPRCSRHHDSQCQHREPSCMVGMKTSFHVSLDFLSHRSDSDMVLGRFFTLLRPLSLVRFSCKCEQQPALEAYHCGNCLLDVY